MKKKITKPVAKKTPVKKVVKPKKVSVKKLEKAVKTMQKLAPRFPGSWELKINGYGLITSVSLTWVSLSEKGKDAFALLARNFVADFTSIQKNDGKKAKK